MWKNIVEQRDPQMTIWCMRIALHCITKVTHTLTICNMYCFSTAKVLAKTCLYVTLYIHRVSGFTAGTDEPMLYKNTTCLNIWLTVCVILNVFSTCTQRAAADHPPY